MKAFPKDQSPLRGGVRWSEEGERVRPLTVAEFAEIASAMSGICHVVWNERREAATLSFPLNRRVSDRSTDEGLLKLHIRLRQGKGFDLEASGVAWGESECTFSIPCDEEKIRRMDQSGAKVVIRPVIQLNGKKQEWSATIISVKTSAFRF